MTISARVGARIAPASAGSPCGSARSEGRRWPLPADFRRIGRRWLSGREDQRAWSFVWQRLLELAPDDTDLRRIGRDWLGGREDRPEWTFVWQPLLRHAPGDSEFRKIGRKWLSGREDHRAWGFVWQRLFALDPGDTDLRKTGREWLDRNKTHPARKAVRRRLDKSHSEARSIGSSKTDISVLSGSSRASSAKAR